MSQRQKRSILQRSTMGVVLLLFHCCAISASAVDVTYTVSSNSDDASQDGGGTVYVSSSDAYMSERGGWRFQNVTIPNGATITNATLEVFASGGGTASFSVDILAQDSDSTSAFTTSSGNISSRPQTSAQTPWSIGSTSFTDGQSITSPNFAGSIQEVIDRAGWASGNSLVVLTTPNSGDKGISQRDRGVAYAPQLHISYTTAAAGSLVGHWTFDEGTGTSVNDSSGGGNHASFDDGTPTWSTEGVRGGALELDGSSDVDTLANFATPSTGTVSLWFRFASAPTSTQRLLGNNTLYQIYADSSGTIHAALGDSDTGSSAAGAAVAGQWRHLAVTYNSDTDAYAYYLDGTLVDSGTSTIEAIGAERLQIGSNHGSTERFAGRLDDVRIYDYELSQSEVTALYTGLVGHWRLDETSGTTAADSSGADNDGTHTGGTTVNAAGPFPGKGAVAADFDGSDDHVDLPNSGTSFSSGFAAAMWVKADTVPSSGQTRAFLGLSNGSTVDEIWLGVVGGVGFQLYMTDTADGSSLRTLEDNTDIVAGQWTHYVATVDAAGNARLYRNGTLVKSGFTSLPRNTTRTEVFIGNSPTNDYFDGSIYDVRLYDHDLSEAEIAAIYGLVGHWKLDDGSGTTASDSSLSGNDGTFVGSPTWRTDGVYSGGLEYDYTDGNDYVEIPSTTVLDQVQLEDYSMACWFKPSSVPPATGSDNLSGYGLIKKRNSSLGLHYSHITGFQFNHYADEGSGGVQQAITSTGNYPGKWHHVVATVNVSAGLVSMYVNGELVGTNSFTPGSPGIDYGTQVWRLGISNPGGSSSERPAHGVQDDARLYNRVLSAAEVAELYGLLGHWKFDEGTGTQIADETEFENDAAFNTGTPVWIDGVRGGALEFDGTNDALTADTLTPPEQGTVALWFRSDGVPTSRQRLWGLGGNFEMWQDTDGLVSFDVATDGFQGGFITTDPLYQAGRWYHLAAIYDSSDESYQIYINGTLHKSGTSTWDISAPAANLLSFGTRTGSTQRFSGAIDDFRVYNRKLTASDIAELYGLVGHWKFDEGTGSTAADSTPYGNDATLSGATWTTSCEDGNALAFNGTGGIAATGTDFSPPETGTVAFWLRGAGTPSARGRIMGVNGDWEARQETTGVVKFDLGASPFIGDEPFTTESVDEPDRWRHIVATYDASDDNFEVYVNGELQTSGTSPVDLVAQAPGILSFGTRTGSTEYWEGALRDFRVYNRQITSSEIAEIYGSLGHWKMDETSGTIATDSSGSDNHGSYVGSPTLGVTSRYPVKLGTAVEFDGTNRMEVAGRLGSPANVTLAAWAKLDSADAGGSEVISIGNSFALRLDDFNNLVSFIYNGSDYNTRVTQAQNYQGTGWHHFAAVFNDTDDLYELYVDGVLVDTITTTDSISWTDAPNTTIGAHAWADGNFDFSGSIDDVRVLGRALCAADVYNLYRDFRPAGVRIKQWVETR